MSELEREYDNSNLAIVNMIDELLAQDNFVIFENDNGDYELRQDIELDRVLIDIYETRAAAYRAAIDCLIEVCIEAWEKGGQE